MGRGNVDDSDREVSRWSLVATLAPRQRHTMPRAPDTGTFRPQDLERGSWFTVLLTAWRATRATSAQHPQVRQEVFHRAGSSAQGVNS